LQTGQELESKARFAETVRQSIREDVFKAKSNKEKGDRFLEWVVTRLFDASPDEIRNQITDGKDDMGIDGWIQPDIEEENGGIIQLFQCKFNESHDENEILQFKQDVMNFLKMKREDIPRDDMKLLQKKIIEENLTTELYYITDKEVNLSKKPRKMKVYGINQIVDHLWDEMIGIPKGVELSVKLDALLPYKDTVIGVISLSELRKFIEKSYSFIYESNIRKYLQRTKINKRIEETLEDRANNIFYFNNGITIVVKDLEVIGNEVKLVEPQIVNGAQTSKTIYEKLPLITNAQGGVQVTVIKESNATTRKEITKFRNSQNAVKGQDLISLEAFHSGIRAQLKNFGYYYEQQAGAWLNMIPRDKAFYKGHDVYNNYLQDDKVKTIKSKEAIQALYAGIFQNPTKAYSSVASFMPNGTQYPKIFDKKLREDYKLLLYPYLVKSYGEKLGFGSTEAKPEQKRYARLLFVAAYFKILLEYILRKDAEVIKRNPEPLERIFKNFDINKKLLDLTNEAMDFYFHCARKYFDDHDEIVTWHNFFSKQAWNTELQKDFKSFLKDKDDELKEIRNQFL